MCHAFCFFVCQPHRPNKNYESKFKRLADRRHDNTAQKKESNLRELNLSSNCFSKVPACLSCLTPHLVKLNLSANKLVAMGAVCDLPKSLKFLDLSNNSIKFSMRLLNERLLNLIFNYFECLSTNTLSDHDYMALLSKLSAQYKVLLFIIIIYCPLTIFSNLIQSLNKYNSSFAIFERLRTIIYNFFRCY